MSAFPKSTRRLSWSGTTCIVACLAWGPTLFLAAAQSPVDDGATRSSSTGHSFNVNILSGWLELDWNAPALSGKGWKVVANQTVPGPQSESAAKFPFPFPAIVRFRPSEASTDAGAQWIEATLPAEGILMIDRPNGLLRLSHPVLIARRGGPGQLSFRTPDLPSGRWVLNLEGYRVGRPPRPDGSIVLVEVQAFVPPVSETGRTGTPADQETAASWALATVRVVVDRLRGLVPTVEPEEEAVVERRANSLVGGSGADLIVADLQSTMRWDRVGEVTAYSVGTVSCNVGTVPLNWFSTTPDHPVIAQNMYRLLNGRFEQIGLSWVKHGFETSTGTVCSGPGGCIRGLSDQQLGVGCSDPYSRTLNGFQANLGPRSQVNAATGTFPYPFTAPAFTTVVDRRLQVHDEDLDPALNAGARYFVEGQYLLADDAAAGNQDNNAAYREVTVVETSPRNYQLIFPDDSETQREKPGILAWKDIDPSVELTYLDVPGDRRLILGSQVTDLGGGRWRYEYALQNLNSDRSVRAFVIPASPDLQVSGPQFHDVHDHSGSPYGTADWDFSRTPDKLQWATEPHDVNENANALRWGSLYNFRFEANSCPVTGSITLVLFKPGTPEEVSAAAPIPDFIPVLQSTDPPDGAVDAGQPSDIAGFNQAGWRSIRMSFDPVPRCAHPTPADFLVTQLGGTGSAPLVDDVEDLGSGQYEARLSSPISTRAWTIITHLPSNRRVRLGFLPGDVNGDRVCNAYDVSAIVDTVNGVGPARPIWHTDINRIKGVDPTDILRVIDLLNGAGVFDPYLGATLDPPPP